MRLTEIDILHARKSAQSYDIEAVLPIDELGIRRQSALIFHLSSIMHIYDYSTTMME